jgi:hypothetical protein
LVRRARRHLPASTYAPNWSLAWVGLDLAEAVAALLAAVLLGRVARGPACRPLRAPPC